MRMKDTKHVDVLELDQNSDANFLCKRYRCFLFKVPSGVINLLIFERLSGVPRL